MDGNDTSLKASGLRSEPNPTVPPQKKLSSGQVCARFFKQLCSECKNETNII